MWSGSSAKVKWLECVVIIRGIGVEEVNRSFQIIQICWWLYSPLHIVLFICRNFIQILISSTNIYVFLNFLNKTQNIYRLHWNSATYCTYSINISTYLFSKKEGRNEIFCSSVKAFSLLYFLFVCLPTSPFLHSCFLLGRAYTILLTF